MLLPIAAIISTAAVTAVGGVPPIAVASIAEAGARVGKHAKKQALSAQQSAVLVRRKSGDAGGQIGGVGLEQQAAIEVDAPKPLAQPHMLVDANRRQAPAVGVPERALPGPVGIARKRLERQAHPVPRHHHHVAVPDGRIFRRSHGMGDGEKGTYRSVRVAVSRGRRRRPGAAAAGAPYRQWYSGG